ncbi:hypothetical protein [Pelagovum sp. HNIBRBA483]|uniref:hypothetical protein n=1 Tax=Pelagovum sp. HNIBRBA483 TaxID=3233341 RepID=UPI0034A17DA7
MTRTISLSLHLGAHKTASTHLQHALKAHEEQLIAAGVRFYGPQYLRERDRSIPQMFGVGTAATTGRSAPLQLEFLAKDSDRVILSEENFLGKLFDERGVVGEPLYPLADMRINGLSQRLPHSKLRVFLAVRRPDTFLNSIYSQVLFGGLMLPPERFRERNDVSAVSWLGLVQRIARIPAISEVFLWCYEDYPKNFTQIIERLVGPGLGAYVAPQEEPVHPGLSAEAAAYVLRQYAEGKKGALAQQARKKFPVSATSPKLTIYDEADQAQAEMMYYRQLQEIARIEKVQILGGEFADSLGVT